MPKHSKYGRYLKKSGTRWWFQMAVPKDLRDRFGRTHILVPLNTSDQKVAERERWRLAHEWQTRFERARDGRPLQGSELEEAAAEEMRVSYEHLAENPVYGEEGLDAAIFAYTDIDDGTPDYQAVRPRAEATLDRIGAPRTEANIRTVSDALVDGMYAARSYFRRNVQPPPRQGRARSRTVSGSAPSVSEAARLYLDRRRQDGDAAPTEQTLAQMEATFRLFSDYMRDAPLDAVTRRDADDFLNTLASLRPDYGRSPEARGLSLSELLRRFPAEEGNGVSNKTLNRHASALHGLFRWARKSGHMDEGASNPFSDQSREVARKTWKPFTVDELNALFAGERFDVAPNRHKVATDRPWVMAIALYAGLRAAEVCDLDAEDVREEECVAYRQDGSGKTVAETVTVPFIDVTEAKSEAGVRRVPVHSVLLDLSLMDYVRRIGSGPLFPGLAPGVRGGSRAHTISKRFAKFRRDRGVTRRDVAFHSFRKCFVSALARAEVDHYHTTLLVGHEADFTRRVYNPEGLPLPTLREKLERVRYPGLKLP